MSASIFRNATVKILRDILSFKTGNQITYQGSVDPSSSATTGEPGDLYVRTTGAIYRKTDSGSSTNWLLITDSGVLASYVTGPGSATDNAVTRFDGTTGKIIQNSGVTIGDTNNVAGIADLTVTGTTTLAVALSGVVKAASGVISAATLVNADVSASAAIDATKIADGSVTNTEFQYVNGVTSAIQTQIDTKVTGPGSSTDNAVSRFDSTTGKIVQNSGVIIDDSNNVTGVAALTVTGTTTLATTLTGVLQGASGVVSASSLVAVAGFKSGAQTVSAATETTIQFDAEERDDGGVFNTGTYTITIPTTGWYKVGCNVELGGLAAEVYILRIKQNSTAVATYSQYANASATTWMIHRLFYFTAADAITFTIDSAADTSYTITTGAGVSNFYCYRVV